jgi:hypothetical protein
MEEGEGSKNQRTPGIPHEENRKNRSVAMITNPPADFESSGGPASAGLRADLYLQLATASAQQGQRSAESRFLLLAAAAADEAGLLSVAEGCRERIVRMNPDHTLRRFSTVREALTYPEFASYVRELGEAYPAAKGDYLLERYRAAGFDGRHPFNDELSAYRWPIKKVKRVASAVRRPSADREPVRTLPNDEMEEESADFTPMPFEWPAASRPVTTRLSSAWAAMIGLLIGLSLGIWIAPRLGPIVETLQYWWEKAVH